MPRVNPLILRWARETAGLSPDEAAKKVDLLATRQASAADRIVELEEGRVEPSRPLLTRMAKQYRRPLLAFYLPEPPRRGNRGQDFRTLPDDFDEADESLLDALLRDILARQSLVRDALEDEDEPRTLGFVGSMRMDAGVDAAVRQLSEALGSPIAAFRRAADPESAFSFLRGQVESLGVYVVLLGNLGSHHSALTLETFRGLAIADPIAPFVVINDQDSRAAWSFSLIHELTHLWLGESGISGGSTAVRDVELFCNSVASEFLLPSSEIVDLYRRSAPSADELGDWINDLSGRVQASRTMIAFRLFTLDVITRAQWTSLASYYREQWLANRERRREQGRESSGGPNYYVVRRQRLGNALLGTAYRLMSSGILTTAKTARVLGVKVTQVEPLLGGHLIRSRVG